MNPKRQDTLRLRSRAAQRKEKALFLWHMPSLTSGCLLLLGCIIGAGMWRDWVWLLDTFTLALHEAGHPIVGMLSARMMVYGGTLFQLLFPWITKRHFKKINNLPGIVFSQYWMAASMHNIGIYMADARAKNLPLVGGLDPEDAHDWAEILGRWGLLRQDVLLGNTLMLAAWLLLGWAMWRCYRDVRDESLKWEPQKATQKEEAFVAQFKSEDLQSQMHQRRRPEQAQQAPVTPPDSEVKH